MPLSLYLLALAAFAMGTSEFMLSGLLPAIAVGFDVSVGTAGLLTSAFAAGMAVGAPLMAVLARSWSPPLSLFGFVVVFLVAHVAGAVTTSFAVLLVSRVLAALANAGFLAVAMTTVAVLCVPAAIGVLQGIPAHRERVAPSALRPELAELLKPRLALVIALAVLVNAVTFGHFTFLAPVVTDVAGLSEWWVPVALVLFGVGSFLGVAIGGRFADTSPRPVVAFGGP